MKTHKGRKTDQEEQGRGIVIQVFKYERPSELLAFGGLAWPHGRTIPRWSCLVINKTTAPDTCSPMPQGSPVQWPRQIESMQRNHLFGSYSRHALHSMEETFRDGSTRSCAPFAVAIDSILRRSQEDNVNVQQLFDFSIDSVKNDTQISGVVAIAANKEPISIGGKSWLRLCQCKL